MASSHLSSSGSDDGASKGSFPTWLKVSAIAAASAAVGGLAAAWFYRETLKKLQELESSAQNTNFGSEDMTDGDGL